MQPGPAFYVWLSVDRRPAFWWMLHEMLIESLGDDAGEISALRRGLAIQKTCNLCGNADPQTDHPVLGKLRAPGSAEWCSLACHPTHLLTLVLGALPGDPSDAAVFDLTYRQSQHLTNSANGLCLRWTIDREITRAGFKTIPRHEETTSSPGITHIVLSNGHSIFTAPGLLEYVLGPAISTMQFCCSVLLFGCVDQLRFIVATGCAPFRTARFTSPTCKKFRPSICRYMEYID